ALSTLGDSDTALWMGAGEHALRHFFELCRSAWIPLRDLLRVPGFRSNTVPRPAASHTAVDRHGGDGNGSALFRAGHRHGCTEKIPATKRDMPRSQWLLHIVVA